MSSFEIEGGYELQGEIWPQGAKNEALQVISAVLLTGEPVTIHKIPNIRDVNFLIEILGDLGVDIQQQEKETYRFHAKDIDLSYLLTDEFRDKGSRLRGSVMILGPLLTRFGTAYLPKPGGDKIGRRRLDTHLEGFTSLNASFQYQEHEGVYKIIAANKRLQGACMLLDEASVTGTANIIMAAVLASGKTTIFNAACEPYITQLCKMLIRMGASIQGIGSNLLTIEGVEKLHGTTHTLLPDMIEVGSFIGMAGMNGSEITLKKVHKQHLGNIPQVFKKLGITTHQVGDDLVIPKQKHYEVESFFDGSIMTIADAPWPGFTPDLISIALVVATQARGAVLIHQKMFESRLFFVDKLIDMGAQIILCDPHRATVIGQDHKTRLKGIEMTSPDIRAGVALLIAALSAKGKSVIHNIEQIDRGYQHIDERLQAIGARIKRIP
jgi:UDP-N-acetylglucosamine 1-carboxyvinyltransferase